MIEFLLFCLAAVGMTSIIVQGVIFQPFRTHIGNWADRVRAKRAERAEAAGKEPRRSLIEWFSDLINCAQCTGFWCGLFCGLVLISSYEMSQNLLQIANRLLMWFCCGLAGSFLSSFGCNFGDWMFYRKMNALRQLEEQDIILTDLHAQHVHHHEEHHHDEHQHEEQQEHTP